jgi:uncharacterized protein
MTPPLPQPTRYLLQYTGVEDFLPLALEHGSAHVERLRDFQARGLVLLAGPLVEPFNGESLAVFTTREAAEEFVAGDPFVRHGVVAGWSIRGWAEGLASG